ncbi:hypothetical protein MYCTH_2307703 [Thermothelomyces thermophilus ATCC 42464]|uniref:Uncharacterized protein n=1 Tax=Thermothelomyces thermophilus (strain ATCC 42464 / BCRC 31852 / DSM 1799) TaxID=573729 RepID=G2QGK5_THET4|nr:uncharacterized protein MYCTH_2307703 [Thermothelomyces thermophilus ATCC 42464]AEO59415.1 hypothetical protein MYCTH_2307703 [Thermothelomyces thermophilus ATCC 42464]
MELTRLPVSRPVVRRRRPAGPPPDPRTSSSTSLARPAFPNPDTILTDATYNATVWAE